MLTGDLTDFSFREIVGFLASTSASGVLELSTVEHHAGVVLDEGGICVALREVDSVRGLVARMLHAGAIDADEVRKVAADGAVDAVDLAAAIAKRAAGHKATDGIFREHTCEIITWLTRRDGVRFSFARSERPRSWPLSALDHDELLDDVDACADGWDQLSDVAGDLTRVCSQIPDAPSHDGVVLTPEQWRVLSLVDGRRTLADVIELCGIGYLETCRQLRQLIDDGLVEVMTSDTTSRVEDLLASYDIVLPIPTGVADEIEEALAGLEVDGQRDADVEVPALLELPVAPVDAELDADTAEADANDVGVDDDDAIEGDSAHDEANRQLLRRLMGRRSTGA